jgi:cell division protein FtsL
MAKNQYRKQGLTEEEQEALQETVEEKAEATQSFLKDLLSSERFSSKKVVEYVPFLIFLSFLAMLYIANRHYAEKTIRNIDRLSREVKEMSWDYKSLSAELMKLSTQSEIAKRVDTMGLHERKQAPMKIVIKKEKK